MATPNLNVASGWYVALGVGTAVLVSGTMLAPLAFGVMTVALIYQLQLMLQGK